MPCISEATLLLCVVFGVKVIPLNDEFSLLSVEVFVEGGGGDTRPDAVALSVVSQELCLTLQKDSNDQRLWLWRSTVRLSSIC